MWKLTKVKDLDTRYANPTVCPGVSRQEIERLGGLSKLPLKEKVSCFEERYRVWMFDYAQLFVPTQYGGTAHDERICGNAGFAILAILNPYFNVVGHLCAETLPSKSEQAIKEGVRCVFPPLAERGNLHDELVNKIYMQTRNSIAHNGLTGEEIVLDGSYDNPLVYGLYAKKTTLVINPFKWYEHLREHFDRYIRVLKLTVPEVPARDTELQSRFDARFHTLGRLNEVKS